MEPTSPTRSLITLLTLTENEIVNQAKPILCKHWKPIVIIDILPYCSRQEWAQLSVTKKCMNEFIKHSVTHTSFWISLIQRDFPWLKQGITLESLPKGFHCELYQSLQKGQYSFRPSTLLRSKNSIDCIILNTDGTQAFIRTNHMARSNRSAVEVWKLDKTLLWSSQETLDNFSTDLVVNPKTGAIISAGAVFSERFESRGLLRVWQPDGQSYRLTATLKGPTQRSLAHLTIHPATGEIISGSFDGTLGVWKPDGERYRLAARLTGHDDKITSLAIHPTTGEIISGSSDRTLGVWKPDGESYRLVDRLTGHTGYVTSLAIHPTTGKIISGSYDGMLGVWKPGGESYRLTARLKGHRDAVMSLAIHPTTGEIISGSLDVTLGIWKPDGESYRLADRLTGHSDAVMSLAIHPTTGEIISGSQDKTLRKWTLNSHALINRIKVRLECRHAGLSIRFAKDPINKFGVEDLIRRIYSFLTSRDLGMLSLVDRPTARLFGKRVASFRLPTSRPFAWLTKDPISHVGSFLNPRDRKALSLVNRQTHDSLKAIHTNSPNPSSSQTVQGKGLPLE